MATRGKLHSGRSREGQAAEFDAVTAEVIRGGMETVAYEMATHVSLTATTPILNQSNERTATILDGRGALAALSVGIPQFMLSSTLPVRFALEFFQLEGLNEGDVLVANDPYHGGGQVLLERIQSGLDGRYRARGGAHVSERHAGLLGASARLRRPHGCGPQWSRVRCRGRDGSGA